MILGLFQAILNPLVRCDLFSGKAAWRLGRERSAIEKRIKDMALISNAQPKPMVVMTTTLIPGASARPRL